MLDRAEVNHNLDVKNIEKPRSLEKNISANKLSKILKQN